MVVFCSVGYGYGYARWIPWQIIHAADSAVDTAGLWRDIRCTCCFSSLPWISSHVIMSQCELAVIPTRTHTPTRPHKAWNKHKYIICRRAVDTTHLPADSYLLSVPVLHCALMENALEQLPSVLGFVLCVCLFFYMLIVEYLGIWNISWFPPFRGSDILKTPVSYISYWSHSSCGSKSVSFRQQSFVDNFRRYARIRLQEFRLILHDSVMATNFQHRA